MNVHVDQSHLPLPKSLTLGQLSRVISLSRWWGVVPAVEAHAALRRRLSIFAPWCKFFPVVVGGGAWNGSHGWAILLWERGEFMNLFADPYDRALIFGRPRSIPRIARKLPAPEGRAILLRALLRAGFSPPSGGFEWILKTYCAPTPTRNSAR